MTSTKMDDFLILLSTQDIRKKLNVGNDILNYLADDNNSIECSDIGLFIDNVVPWIQNSNFKVAQSGLEMLYYIVDRLGSDFRAYLPTVLASIIDRLGDGKENVRDKCRMLFMKMLEKDVISPKNLFDKLVPAFSHKNSNIREETMKVLVVTLEEYGAQSITIARLVPHLVKLLSDPSHEVRETAISTMTEIYKHVGDKLRVDLQKNHKVPQNKLSNLLAKFEEIKAAGELLPSASSALSYNDEDESDRVYKPKRMIGDKRLCSSYGQQKIAAPQSVPVAGSSNPTSKCGRSITVGRRTSSVTAAGAVDEEAFINAFEDVPAIPLISHKELDMVMRKIREQINASGENWDKRVDAMKRLRAVLLSGATQYDELFTHIKSLDIPLENALKDLRSQVVREACITVAFLSQQLQHKFDHTAEFVILALMGLIQNSAKVISSSGITTVRFIVTYTHAPRLIPLLVSNLSSKSRDIRRATCEFLDLILHIWNTHSLERHIALLQDAIKKGLSDADSEARIHARKSYWHFKKHFPEQAESMLGTLDVKCKQKLILDAPGNMSNSSSNNSLHQSGIGSSLPVGHRVSRQSADSPRRMSTLPVQAGRSNSAIDLQAAQRAKARAQYAALARQKVGSGASLPRAKKLPDLGLPSSQISTPVHTAQHPAAGGERVGRTRSRIAGVSQSQPSSRSGSPSSKLNYVTFISSEFNLPPPRSRSVLKPFCRSTGTSRETSPNRFPSIQAFGVLKLRHRPNVNLFDRPPIHSSRPVMAQKILQQSREAESALADALSCEPSEGIDSTHRVSPKKTSYKPFEEHSDDSETSSVCSERSDTFRRPSDSFSWSGSQQRLYRDLWEPSSKTISEIIANCESIHWSDRKEGLVGLQMYFQSGNVLTPSELKRVTDNFTKMFMDSHTKVFSLFLDTLNELITTHRADLNSWLYVLLTRLLNKLGADLLGSIQTKIHKSLEVVRESFPCELQMLSVLRFLVDATQTPNARVKTAALNYVTKLAAMTDPHLAFPPPNPGQTKDIATAAITKMIGWTMGDSIKQGSELRRAVQETILALFNLNTPQVTMRFSQLPKEYQEAAATLIQGRVRRSSNGNLNTSTQSPPSSTPTSPVLHSPAPQRQRFSQHSSDTENLNPEEVYRSLRKTTAEIQNYSYESGRGKLTEQITTSQDSGISQMSPVDRLEEQMDHMSLRACPGAYSLPTISSGNGNEDTSSYHSRVLTPRDYNGMGMDSTDNGNQSKDYTPEDLQELSETMRKIIESLKPAIESESVTESRSPLSEEEQKAALTELMTITRDCSSVVILEHFKYLLRVLLGLMNSTNGTIKVLVLGVLAEMLKKRALTDNFNNYVELLILKVLHVYRDPCKDAVRAAELCINIMATTMAPDMIIRVLAPLIATEDYPINLASVKMLTRLVEKRGSDPLSNYLGDLMPGLIQAYDNEDSSVRKSAVFCMVALHSAVGEEALKPHLAVLVGSKLKLLHLYIRRAQQGTLPTSPKSQPPSSGASS